MIEFAICLPVLFLIVMATIETCRMLYLRQSLKIAAYESARLGIVPGATREDLNSQCDLILGGRKIKDYAFTCNPNDPSSLKYGDLLVTNVKISAEANAILNTWIYRNQIFSESVTIMAEY